MASDCPEATAYLTDSMRGTMDAAQGTVYRIRDDFKFCQVIPFYHMTQAELLQFDPAAALDTSEISHQDVADIWGQLAEARQEMLDADLKLFRGEGEIPRDKQPLDAGFIEWPDRMLQAYEQDRQQSELGQILEGARRLGHRVDRVVVLGIGGSYMGARALIDACALPFYNEWSRGERGGRPRLYFAGNNLDNDRTQALLRLLASQSPSAGSDPVENRWGIVVISKSGGTLETAVAFRQFLNALKQNVDEPSELAERVVPITGKEGKLARLADEIGCRDRFLVPDGIGGRFSVLTAVGLFPAALLGLDIVALLRGAWMMNARFIQGEQGHNPVMDYVAINHLLETKFRQQIRVLSIWNDSLESFGWWYDQLLAESLGKAGRGATPITAVNTRDLHSRAQQHQEGRNDKVFNDVVVRDWRHDPLPVGKLDWNHDELDDVAELTLPDLMRAAVQGTQRALASDHRPTTTLTLPRADENAMGQLFQMLMLATVLEGRLLGINPYGQPGVEKYKRQMKAILENRSPASLA